MEPCYAMLEEIKEQEGLLREIYERRKELTANFVQLAKKRKFKKVLFVGNGSPYYAGCTLRYAAEKLLGVEAEAIPAGLFYNHASFNASGVFRPEEILLVCPAESGHSRGQVDAARMAKSQGIAVMSTTLNPAGVLARTSDVILAKPGMHEIAMAATKGQTMAIYMILLNFLEAGYQLGNIDRQTYEYYQKACAEVPGHVAASIEDTMNWFKKHRDAVMGVGQYFLLGYGANYGTVQEAALKFFECHSKPTIALELEESLHGPFRALGKKDMVFFIAAEAGTERERMLCLVDAAKRYCDNMIIIESIPVHENSLRIHSSDVEFVDAIEYLIPLQVLSYLIADGLGIDLSIPLVGELDGVMLPAYED